MGLENTRLLIVVENTDYRAALSDIFMPEQLNEQLSGRVSPVDIHILTAAVRWSEQVQEVAIFSCYSAEKYSEMTYLKVRIMGSGFLPTAGDGAARFSLKASRELVRLVGDFCPDYMVLSVRSPVLLSWAVRNRLSTLALFSDWHEPVGFWKRLQHRQFIRNLNRKCVDRVGGHGLQASKILADSGINPEKIIPWEWSQPQLLVQYTPKQMRDHQYSVKLVHVGQLDQRSGIEDLLQAAIYLRRSGYTVDLQLIRNTLNDTSPVETHETDWLERQVQQLELADSVSVWAGLAPEQMLSQVREADLAVIPRPPLQPVRLPPLGVAMAMAACTPIVACDHPHFDAHLLHSFNAIVFPLGNAISMAHRIERIMGQPTLYADLSEASGTGLRKLKVPARWDELIDKWMQGTEYDKLWLRSYALSSGRYKPVEVERSLTEELSHPSSTSLEASPFEEAEAEAVAIEEETSVDIDAEAMDAEAMDADPEDSDSDDDERERQSDE